MDLAQYKLPTGYYDESAIMQAAGMSERAARFADIFGNDDSDGGQPQAQLAPQWQALLDEARRLNAEMYAAETQAKEAEARTLMAAPEPWSRETWKALKRLGFAWYDVDIDMMEWRAGLTEPGEQLLDPNYRTPGTYGDQVE